MFPFKLPSVTALENQMNTVTQQLQSLGTKIHSAINKGDELTRSYQAMLTELNSLAHHQNKFNLNIQNELQELRAMISTQQGAQKSSTESSSSFSVPAEELVTVVPAATQAVRKARAKKAVETRVENAAKKTRTRKTKE